MTILAESIGNHSSECDGLPPGYATDVLRILRHYFDTDFALWDSTSGGFLHWPAGPAIDDFLLSALVRVVAIKNEAEYIAEAGPICVLAIPISVDQETTWVATAPLVIAAFNEYETSAASQLLGLSAAEFNDWFVSQTIWTTPVLQ